MICRFDDMVITNNIDLYLASTPLPPVGILQGYAFLKSFTKCYIISHVSPLSVGAFRILGVKPEETMQKTPKIGIIFNFFLKADIEEQYMHLGSTFNYLSNDTNYMFQFHRKMFFFGGGGMIFHNFIIFFLLFYRFDSRFLLIQPK